MRFFADRVQRKRSSPRRTRASRRPRNLRTSSSMLTCISVFTTKLRLSRSLLRNTSPRPLDPTRKNTTWATWRGFTSSCCKKTRPKASDTGGIETLPFTAGWLMSRFEQHRESGARVAAAQDWRRAFAERQRRRLRRSGRRTRLLNRHSARSQERGVRPGADVVALPTHPFSAYSNPAGRGRIDAVFQRIFAALPRRWPPRRLYNRGTRA